MLGTLTLRRSLADSARLPSWLKSSDTVSIREAVVLTLCGASAGLLMVFLPWQIRQPGSAILRVVFPLALGMSLVPRRGSGTIMSLVGAGVVALLWSQGFERGHLPSILAVLGLGTFEDLALSKSGSGWRTYPRFALAGCLANLTSFIAKWGFLSSGGDWNYRLTSFLICGAVAGLASAIVWFRATAKRT